MLNLPSLFLNADFQRLEYLESDALAGKIKPAQGRMWLITGGTVGHDNGTTTLVKIKGKDNTVDQFLAMVDSAYATTTYPLFCYADSNGVTFMTGLHFVNDTQYVHTTSGNPSWKHRIVYLEWVTGGTYNLPVDVKKQLVPVIPQPLLVKSVGVFGGAV